jgi:hypothetical protein
VFCRCGLRRYEILGNPSLDPDVAEHLVALTSTNPPTESQTQLRRLSIHAWFSSEDIFDLCSRLVVQTMGIRSAVISFVESERQWFMDEGVDGLLRDKTRPCE